MSLDGLVNVRPRRLAEKLDPRKRRVQTKKRITIRRQILRAPGRISRTRKASLPSKANLTIQTKALTRKASRAQARRPRMRNQKPQISRTRKASLPSKANLTIQTKALTRKASRAQARRPRMRNQKPQISRTRKASLPSKANLTIRTSGHGGGPMKPRQGGQG